MSNLTAILDAPKETRLRPKATAEMLAKRKAALEALRSAGGLSDAIPNPVEWQRESRVDRSLPGLD